MDGLGKRESCEFDNYFKSLPTTNRVKLIKTAKSLLEAQRASKENTLPADTLILHREAGKAST